MAWNIEEAIEYFRDKAEDYQSILYLQGKGIVKLSLKEIEQKQEKYENNMQIVSWLTELQTRRKADEIAKAELQEMIEEVRK